MDNETIFYALGISLVCIAVVVAFVGLRWERFPGARGLMTAVIAVFASLVVATGVFAWRSAEDEQDHRAEELALAAEESESEGEEAVTEGAGEGETTAVAADGAAVFEAQGCGACHTLEAAGSTATIGPNLDGALEGESTEFIETSIVDPSSQVADGFPPNVMPEDFEENLTPEELDALVQYLADSTQG